jgi:hypothetical protein
VRGNEQLKICGEACEDCAATCRLFVAAAGAGSTRRRGLYAPGDTSRG